MVRTLTRWLVAVLAACLALSPTALARDDCGGATPPAVATDLQGVVGASKVHAPGDGGSEQGPGDEEMKAFASLVDVKADEAPDRITLPDVLVDGMQDAWDDSLPGGRSQEQGGILVVDEKGHYVWKRGDVGESGSWSPNYEDVEDGETLVAVGHTHPYDASEGGYTDVPFSGQDLARLLVVEENIAVVQSGDTVFVAAMTAEFQDRVEGMSDEERWDLFYEMKDAYDEAYADARGSFPDRVSAAVDAVADKYGLVWYRGSGKTLTRVD